MTWRDYFGRIFIINLPERTDRRTEMLRELHGAGLDLEPGRIEWFPAAKLTEAAGFTNAGVHGCFRSHLEILKQARAAGVRNVLILEDDATILNRFRQDEESLIAQLTATDWGIAYFGHALEKPADRRTEMRPYTGSILLSHFYAVNGTIFDRLIDCMEKILKRPAGHPDGGPMPWDGALTTFRQRNPDVLTLVSSPNLSYQRSSRSDLTPKWFDQIPGVRAVVGLLRKAKRTLTRR